MGKRRRGFRGGYSDFLARDLAGGVCRRAYNMKYVAKTYGKATATAVRKQVTKMCGRRV